MLPSRMSRLLKCMVMGMATPFDFQQNQGIFFSPPQPGRLREILQPFQRGAKGSLSDG